MTPYIFANWKMNLSLSQSVSLANLLAKNVNNSIKLVVCPSFTALPAVRDTIGQGHGIMLGAQDMFYESGGAYTGEISGSMLTELGCRYVIVGHSERRAMGENSDIVAKKMVSAIKQDLIPVLCVGESLVEKKAGLGIELVKSQVRTAINGVSGAFLVAYEPIWAIGTGKSADIRDALLMREAIESVLTNTKVEAVLYGGSVDKDNYMSYIKEAGFGGLLIGGASTKDEFAQWINNFSYDI